MVATSVQGKRLADYKPGKAGEVAYYATDYIAGKLMAMGVLPGSQIELVRVSPLGDSLYVKADNQYLALRKVEAACIVMK